MKLTICLYFNTFENLIFFKTIWKSARETGAVTVPIGISLLTLPSFPHFPGEFYGSNRVAFPPLQTSQHGRLPGLSDLAATAPPTVQWLPVNLFVTDVTDVTDCSHCPLHAPAHARVESNTFYLSHLSQVSRGNAYSLTSWRISPTHRLQL